MIECCVTAGAEVTAAVWIFGVPFDFQQTTIFYITNYSLAYLTN